MGYVRVKFTETEAVPGAAAPVQGATGIGMYYLMDAVFLSFYSSFILILSQSYLNTHYHRLNNKVSNNTISFIKYGKER